ncbi:MAG: PfkB family carbohydrate kinase, partial [Anaerolineae bacterium]|nr:PfkB family carbohydrate kinase [Anaerolineae bacterium]
EEEWAKEVTAKFSPEILVIGMGEKGAFMAVKKDGFFGHFPAKTIRPVVSTIGAGDALFSSFLHGYIHNKDPYTALQKAIVFSSYKIGARAASEGFISNTRLNELYNEHYPHLARS